MSNTGRKTQTVCGQNTEGKRHKQGSCFRQDLKNQDKERTTGDRDDQDEHDNIR